MSASRRNCLAGEPSLSSARSHSNVAVPGRGRNERQRVVAWGAGPFDRERLLYSVRQSGSSFTAPRTLGTGVLRNAAPSGAGTHAVIALIAGSRLLMAELTG